MIKKSDKCLFLKKEIENVKSEKNSFIEMVE